MATARIGGNRGAVCDIANCAARACFGENPSELLYTSRGECKKLTTWDGQPETKIYRTDAEDKRCAWLIMIVYETLHEISMNQCMANEQTYEWNLFRVLPLKSAFVEKVRTLAGWIYMSVFWLAARERKCMVVGRMDVATSEFTAPVFPHSTERSLPNAW